MSVLRISPGLGVQFATLRPAGFRILAALDNLARDWPHDIEITCGTEGHPPTDPHSSGEAIDARSNLDPDLDTKQAFVRAVISRLSLSATDVPFAAGGGWATIHFWGWLEHPNSVGGAEHYHFQRRKNTVYP